MDVNGFTLNDLPQDEDTAREMLEAMRWPNGAACPHCGGADPYKLKPKAGSSTRKGVYKCRACRKQFTVTVGTIFESSHIKLTVWLKAVYLLCSSKKGMSALQLQRMLNLKSYKSAWFMAHRLRYAMTQEPLASKLTGIVEVDETYVGGHRKGTKSGRPQSGSHKTAVVALVERNGRARAFPVDRVTSKNLREAILSNVAPESHLMTDDYASYRYLKSITAQHDTISHSRGEYAVGNVHTNTVEGFFSLLKRGINGVYHHVSKGHLGRYCDEFSFRYSNRTVTDSERTVLAVQGAEGKRLTYKQPAEAC